MPDAKTRITPETRRFLRENKINPEHLKNTQIESINRDLADRVPEEYVLNYVKVPHEYIYGGHPESCDLLGKTAWEKGIPAEQMRFIADHTSCSVIGVNRLAGALCDGMDFKNVKLCAGPYSFRDWQGKEIFWEDADKIMEELMTGFEHGLPYEEVSIFAKPGIPLETVKLAREDLESKKYSPSDVGLYAKPGKIPDYEDFDWTYHEWNSHPGSVDEIKRGLKNLPREQAVILSRSGLDGDQTKQLRLAFEENKLSAKDVAVFADAELGPRKIKFFRNYFNELPSKYRDSEEFTPKQKYEILNAFVAGISEKDIALFADPKFKSWQMKEIFQGLREGLPPELVKIYADPAFNEKDNVNYHTP